MGDLAHRRLRTPAAADYLGYAESTLEKKRLTGDGPPFIRLGRVIVYDTRATLTPGLPRGVPAVPAN